MVDTQENGTIQSGVSADHDPYLMFEKGAKERTFLEDSYGPEQAEHLMARLGSRGNPAIIPLLNDPAAMNRFEALQHATTIQQNLTAPGVEMLLQGATAVDEDFAAAY